jgi:DNA polymerase V
LHLFCPFPRPLPTHSVKNNIVKNGTINAVCLSKSELNRFIMTFFSKLEKLNSDCNVLTNSEYMRRFVSYKSDLNEQILDDKRNTTFLVEVTGDSMINVGINSGDSLLVNSNYPISNESIVVGALNGKPFVKRIIFDGTKTLLRSENDNYEDIRVTQLDKLSIWGVARNVIRKY